MENVCFSWLFTANVLHVYTSLYTVGSGLYQRHVATKISKNEEWLALVQVFIATITLQLGKVDFDKEKSF